MTTEIELELLTYINMYNLVKRSTREGIVQCSKPNVTASNKYATEYFSIKESN